MIGAHSGPITMQGGQQVAIPLLYQKHKKYIFREQNHFCQNGLFHRVSRPKDNMCSSFYEICIFEI